jgi:hypothetical protein
VQHIHKNSLGRLNKVILLNIYAAQTKRKEKKHITVWFMAKERRGKVLRLKVVGHNIHSEVKRWSNK